MAKNLNVESPHWHSRILGWEGKKKKKKRNGEGKWRPHNVRICPSCSCRLCRDCILVKNARKHRYGKNPTVPVPDTSWVRILPGYRCMHTPGVSVFGQKKNFPIRIGYGSGRVRYKVKPKRRRFSFSTTPITAGKLRSLSSALCLSLPPPPVLGSLSSALSLTSSTTDARFSLLCSLSLTSYNLPI